MFGSHIKCFRLDMGDGGTKHYYVMKHSPHGEEGLDTLVAGTVIVDLPAHYRAGMVCMLDLRGKCKKVGRRQELIISRAEPMKVFSNAYLICLFFRGWDASSSTRRYLRIIMPACTL